MMKNKIQKRYLYYYFVNKSIKLNKSEYRILVSIHLNSLATEVEKLRKEECVKMNFDIYYYIDVTRIFF